MVLPVLLWRRKRLDMDDVVDERDIERGAFLLEAREEGLETEGSSGFDKSV